MSYTPLEDEEPLNVDPARNVLALRFWVVSGAHNGLCLLNGTGSLTYQLVVFGGNEARHGFSAASPTSRSAFRPAVRTSMPAWSPDGKQIAYIDPEKAISW